MDLRDSAVDRERALLSFYKMVHVEWACPLTCTLKGKLLTHTKLKIKDMFVFFNFHLPDVCAMCFAFSGDPAIGDGVTRHFFAAIMSKVQYGFEIKFGK